MSINKFNKNDVSGSGTIPMSSSSIRSPEHKTISHPPAIDDNIQGASITEDSLYTHMEALEFKQNG